MFASKSNRVRKSQVAVFESMDGRQYCDGDNSLATASDLGLVSSYTVKSSGNLTSGSDTKDFYKFQVPIGSKNFAVKLGGLSKNADLYLYNSSKTEIANSKNGGSTSEVLISNLSPGVYYAEARLKGSSTGYSLKLANDFAGNDKAAAKNIGLLPPDSTLSYSDYAGSLDGNDYYKFTTNADGNLKVQLGSLSANADLELLKSDGTVIALADNGGTTAEQISVVLPAATYYARVKPESLGVDAKYKITFVGPPADVGNSIATAKHVTTPFSGGQTVGNGDFYDFYKIDVPDTNYAVIKLTTSNYPVTLAYYSADGSFVGSDSATAGNSADLSYFVHTGGAPLRRGHRRHELADDLLAEHQDAGVLNHDSAIQRASVRNQSARSFAFRKIGRGCQPARAQPRSPKSPRDVRASTPSSNAADVLYRERPSPPAAPPATAVP